MALAEALRPALLRASRQLRRAAQKAGVSALDAQLLHAIKKHTDWLTAIAYSPDGVLLASGDRQGGLWVWEAKSGNEFYGLQGHKAAITSVCFRDD